MRVGVFVLLLVGANVALASPPADRDGAASSSTGSSLCGTLHARQAVVKFRRKRWDLRKREDLQRLAEALDREVVSADPTRASAPEEPKKPDHSQHLSDSERRALSEMQVLTARALSSDEPSCDALVTLAEIADALSFAGRVPVRKRLDIVQVPFYFWDLMHNPVGMGSEPAWNLAPSVESASSSDTSRADPLPSTFWTRPADIASRDLYHAFGPILTLGTEPCAYHEPKTSYGTTPGFSVMCGEREIKVKFGDAEASRRDTEVAVTRLYHAMGYHVEPNDYAPEVRVRYDRRILLEFNSRKDLGVTLTALGIIPIKRIRIQSVEDPFHYIRSAVTKDGRSFSVDELATRLIRRDILERTERASKKVPKGTHSDHYREDAADFEEELDHLVMNEGNIQARDLGGENLGPWGWDRLDHAKRREIRGAAVLSAWTNYFDVRWDNNRLKLVQGEPDHGIEHAISDLGGSLGRAENFLVDRQGLINDFPWTFTAPPERDRKGRETHPFRIVDYQPIFGNDAFEEMTVDDARWMARLIAQLTENQIQQALIATGYTSAEVKLYTEKLVSRRDAMIRDLGLAEEIRLLRPEGVDPTFDYDPLEDGPIVAHAPDGSELRPIESRDLVVREGRVEPR